MSQEVLVANDKDEHAAFAAEILARAIEDAVKKRGVARVALSGGNTPAEGYRKLGAMKLPFEHIEWFWVDERAVPKDNPRSNFGAAVAQIGSSHGRFFPMEGDAADLAAAAARYEALLRERFGVAAAVAFDALTLGIGDDGHTASLFPGLGVVGVHDRLVTAVPAQPDKKLEPRLTLTKPVLCAASLVVVQVAGESKRKVVEAARAQGPEEEIPSRLIQQATGRVVWLLDKAAAG
jgi:6-phosphogluconolactonase